MCLCTSKPSDVYYLTKTHTISQAHWHTCATLFSWAAGYSRHSKFAPFELKLRFHLKGKHHAPLLPAITGVWKQSQQPQFYRIALSRRESAPFHFWFELSAAGLGFSKRHLKLSYSEREQKITWAPFGKGFYAICWETSSASFFM